VQREGLWQDKQKKLAKRRHHVICGRQIKGGERMTDGQASKLRKRRRQRQGNGPPSEKFRQISGDRG